ncbi:Cd2+/Zn2+-exporting ATPase [Microcella putealis]|uniref:Cd2+/Zn2+-exporting ATPase n=1 Tax=Microcella putealis TaxID=337005 RepID=A0A4Q7LXG1_9MICO|nr:heavy metal translocating P-type ATPase [Microcella putealis]RZS58928.1 Cd2+/Zn2+-exporting ATPase [Microcella putealis]TQM23954.1 Cd2+/Zn2+-exporting ATPase [Microcella putealis]
MSKARAASGSIEQHGHDRADRPWELYFAIAAGITYASGLVAEYAVGAPAAVYVPLFLATYFFGGYFTVIGAFSSVRRGRFEVDFLMIVAAIGAAAVGQFGEGAVLLFLFSLGHALEEYAMSRATKSIEALAALAPRTATVRVGEGILEERPVEALLPGDVLVVRPNSRVPADGFVSVGDTAIDQSAVTGESIPVEKTAVPDSAVALARPEGVAVESRVFAGTVNGPAAFDMVVTAAAGDSTLARVVTLVREADTAQSPTQRFIDRFQRIYVPAVVLGVLGVLAFGLLALSEPFGDAFYRSMVVLVAASPCALAIATPAAVLAGIARSARAGVLTKGGGPLENLAKVRAIAFDKTGTLTWGHPSVTDVAPAPGAMVEELQAVAVAVESLSDHPLAGAIVRDLAERVADGDALIATDLEGVTGRGVRARIEGDEVLVGNLRMMADGGLTLPPEVAGDVDRLQGQGRTTMVVARGGRVLGVIGVMDQPRLESRDTLEALRRDGVSELVMMSGDNQQVADAVGTAVGIDTAMGELLPEDKVAAIRGLGSDGRLTCMVGDGVNDAPAMANATISIAMGAAGSAVALETADIALMSDDLGRVPFIRRLSRATTGIIRQNLIAALAIVAFLVPASLIGLSMGPIVLIHEGSTIIVVLNALRLLRFEVGGEHRGIAHEDRPGTPAPSARK